MDSLSVTRRGAITAVFLLLLVPGAASAQAVGLEVQAYPAGAIFAARVDVTPHWSFFAGVNLTDRRDFGKHDNEEGGGWGLGAGWSPSRRSHGFDVGVRLDVWRLDIDWADFANAGTVGSSRITVVQPTIRADYGWGGGDDAVQVRTGAALGVEVNVRTAGEAVGQGPIFLLGVALLFSI